MKMFIDKKNKIYCYAKNMKLKINNIEGISMKFSLFFRSMGSVGVGGATKAINLVEFRNLFFYSTISESWSISVRLSARNVCCLN